MPLPQQTQDFLSAVFGTDWAEHAILVTIDTSGKVRHMRAGILTAWQTTRIYTGASLHFHPTMTQHGH